MLLKKLVLAAALAGLSSGASAALFHFTGNITHHNDVVTTTFTLNENATNVRVWTDSYLNGGNFDPITALWNATTGALIDENDDNANVNPATQTSWDSGFTLATLSAGVYKFTVATYSNFALGNNLTDGFAYDAETPVLMSEWNQPASHLGMNTYWSVWLDGVSDASNPNNPPTNGVPEPASLALLGLGLAALTLSRKKA